MLHGQGPMPASNPLSCPLLAQRSPTPSCRERWQGTALPPAAHPNSYVSFQLHLEPHGLCPLTPSGNTPHNQAQILVSPHPDRCTFPLISLQRGCTLLCPSRSQAQGDQPTLPLPFQQCGRVRHDKASQSREPVSPPLPSWLPAATGWGSDRLGQLWVGPAASPEREASAGKRSAAAAGLS